MKASSKLVLIITCTCFVSALLCCNKSNDVYTDPNKFTWTYRGTNHVTYQQKAFLYSRGSYNIVAAQGTTLESFPRCEFTLRGFNPGSYAFNNLGVNVFKYFDDSGNITEATAGGINITSYSNDLISGTFSATLSNSSGATTPISGSFINMPVVP